MLKNMNGNINELIALNNKMTSLLQEYKQSLEEEQSDYVVVKIPSIFTEARYILFKRETEKEICYGEKSKIERFIEKRIINKVYWRI